MEARTASFSVLSSGCPCHPIPIGTCDVPNGKFFKLLDTLESTTGMNVTVRLDDQPLTVDRATALRQIKDGGKPVDLLFELAELRPSSQWRRRVRIADVKETANGVNELMLTLASA